MFGKKFWSWFLSCLAIVTAFHLYEVNTIVWWGLQSSVWLISSTEIEEEYKTADVFVGTIDDESQKDNEVIALNSAPDYDVETVSALSTESQNIIIIPHQDDDPCVDPANLQQADNDADGIWDECDEDDDNDDVLDSIDNCPLNYNPWQGQDC